MAIATNLARQRFIGDGSTVNFYFSFGVWNVTQVKIYTGDNRHENQLTTGFNITLNACPVGSEMHPGGVVSFWSAPAAGTQISIVRSMPFIQEDVYTPGSRFDAHEIEDRYDMDCAERQELYDGVLRAVKMPGTSTQTPQQFTDSLFNAADTAVIKAGEAAASASSAAQSAVNSANSASASAASATQASTYASQAATSASAASTSATDASGFANAAANSANNAATSATAAANSAASAASSKTDACDCAETSRKWAVGTISEQPAGSSKFWANKAETIMNAHPSIIRWIFPTVIGQRTYAFTTPDPVSSDSGKYLVFYGTDLLNTNDYVIDSYAIPKTLTLREAPEEVLNLTIAFVAESLVESNILPIGAVYAVVGCENDYVPSGAVQCDGTEYTRGQFPDLYDRYLLQCDTTWKQPILSTDGIIGSGIAAVDANSVLDANHKAYMAMDGDYSTEWVIASGGSIDYKLYNHIAVKMQRITIRNRNIDGHYFTGGMIYGSNDGSAWTTLKSYTNTEGGAGKEWYIDLSTNTNYYKYYLIRFTSYLGTNPGVSTFKFDAGISYKLLKTCTYADYAADIAAYGSCSKWGLDTATQKFKVPTIPDGTFLQQASTAGEMGKSYKHDLANGTAYSHKSVTVRYFVQVANASVNQSTMDWSAWASGLAGKVSKTGDTMTGPLTVQDSGTGKKLVVNPALQALTFTGSDGNQHDVGIDSMGTDWIRYNNGIQIIWGMTISSGTGPITLTFNMPFYYNPIILITPTNSSAETIGTTVYD